MANFLVKLEEINHSIRAAKRGFHLQLELELQEAVIARWDTVMGASVDSSCEWVSW